MSNRTTSADGNGAIHPDTTIGHVHLRVADLDRSLAFYHGVLGFAITGRLGDEAAFLAAGDYHHHLALNTWTSRGGPAPAPGTTGLDHLAIRCPDRRQLARLVGRLLDHGVAIDGAADHGVNEAVYLKDPDGNGIELFWDREPHEWPRDERGGLIPVQKPLPVAALLIELAPATAR